MRLSILRLLAGGLLLLSPPLRAEQMMPLSIGRLAAKAQLIVHGKVLATGVRRDAEGRIYTVVQLQVEGVWKGSLATNRFSIVHGGGAVGDQVAVVSGEATYQVGEEIVAFLVLNPRGEGVSIGLAQGKFNVWKDPATGEKLAHNCFHGLGGTAALPTNVTSAATVVNRLTLADLERRAQGGAK